jgi:hypothetical protein
MLDAMYERLIQNKSDDTQSFFESKELSEKIEVPIKQFEISLRNLARLGLCTLPINLTGISSDINAVYINETKIKITPLGEDFVASCRGPKNLIHST